MTNLAFLSSVGITELVIILIIVLLLFGHRLPGIGRAVGRSVSEFKGGINEGKEKEKSAGKDAEGK